MFFYLGFIFLNANEVGVKLNYYGINYKFAPPVLSFNPYDDFNETIARSLVKFADFFYTNCKKINVPFYQKNDHRFVNFRYYIDESCSIKIYEHYYAEKILNLLENHKNLFDDFFRLSNTKFDIEPLSTETINIFDSLIYLYDKFLVNEKQLINENVGVKTSYMLVQEFYEILVTNYRLKLITDKSLLTRPVVISTVKNKYIGINIRKLYVFIILIGRIKRKNWELLDKVKHLYYNSLGLNNGENNTKLFLFNKNNLYLYLLKAKDKNMQNIDDIVKYILANFVLIDNQWSSKDKELFQNSIHLDFLQMENSILKMIFKYTSLHWKDVIEICFLPLECDALFFLANK